MRVSDVETRRKETRKELKRRGLGDEQIKILCNGGMEANRVIADFIAAGGSRYGTQEE